MNTTMMSKTQLCTATAVLRPTLWQPRSAVAGWLQRALVAGFAAGLVLLLAAFGLATVRAPVDSRAQAQPALAAVTVELPRVVLYGRRWPTALCPVPVDASATRCPVPVNE